MQHDGAVVGALVEWKAEIGADHADRRTPAHAETGADFLFVAAETAERVTRIDEGRDAPVGFEVVLVLRARDDEVLAADDEILAVGIRLGVAARLRDRD